MTDKSLVYVEGVADVMKVLSEYVAESSHKELESYLRSGYDVELQMGDSSLHVIPGLGVMQ